MAQYLLVVDSLNFCFWPHPGLEYEHLAGGIKRAVLTNRDSISAQTLANITEQGVNAFLKGTDHENTGFPNPSERARLLREVGQGLLTQYNGQAARLVRAAQGSAVELVRLLTACCPGFQDHTLYRGRQVFFYKRAQIFVGDVFGCFSGQGLGAFHDMPALTMFPDYRVPAILREIGILVYSQELAAKIDALQELPAGGEEEIEIRAATVVAVERFKEAILRRRSLGRGDPPLSVALDWYLWEKGERLRHQHRPHHRTLTIYY